MFTTRVTSKLPEFTLMLKKRFTRHRCEVEKLGKYLNHINIALITILEYAYTAPANHQYLSLN